MRFTLLTLMMITKMMTMPSVFPSGSLSPCTQPFPSKHAIFGVFIEILITTKPKQSMSFSMMQTATTNACKAQAQAIGFTQSRL